MIYSMMAISHRLRLGAAAKLRMPEMSDAHYHTRFGRARHTIY